MKYSTSTILACFVLLTGCATLSENECRSADWHRLGVKDAQQGEPVSLLDEHKESCARYGIRPDESQYLAGREAGLRQYCQLGNAFRIGMNGEEYKSVCPLDVDTDFRRYNTAALEVHNSKKKIEEIDHQLSAREHELSEKDTPEKEQHRLREEIRELDRLMDEARYHGGRY